MVTKKEDRHMQSHRMHSCLLPMGICLPRSSDNNTQSTML